MRKTHEQTAGYLWFFFNAITYIRKRPNTDLTQCIKKERACLNIILTLLIAVTKHSFFWMKSEKSNEDTGNNWKKIENL